MKKIKRLHILIEWLMVICMISVGYSGWAITVPSEKSPSGSINAYPVIKADDYVTIGDVQMFDYCDIGFISDQVSVGDSGVDLTGKTELNLSQTGTIKIPVTVKAPDFKNTYGNKMCIEMSLAFESSKSIFQPNMLSLTEATSTITSGFSYSEGPFTVYQDIDLSSHSNSFEIEFELSFMLNEDKFGNFGINVIMQDLQNTTLTIQTIVKDTLHTLPDEEGKR